MTRLGARDLDAPGPTSRGSGSSPSTTPADASWRWRLGATLGLTALLLYLTVTPLPPFASNVYDSLLRRYIVLGAIALGYVAWLLIRQRLPHRSIFDLPLAALTLAVLVAVAGSSDRRVSLEAVLPLLPSLVLFYLLHDLRVLDARAFAWAVWMAAGLIAVIALASVWRAWDDWLTLIQAVDGGIGWSTVMPPQTPRIAGVGSHPNVLAAVFAMALPPSLLLWTATTRRSVRVVLVAGTLLVAVALFFTLSRAAWAATAAGVITTTAGFLLAGRRRIRMPRWLWPALAAAAVVLALAAVWLLAGDARPEWLFRDSLSPRADMRRAGWEMFRDNPLTGTGPGLFVALYPVYGGAHPFAAVHSHNIVVQTAVDTGLLGLAAAVALALVSAGAVWTVMRRGSIGDRRAVGAATGMLAAGLVHALADSPQLFPEVQLIGVIALVMIARSVESDSATLSEPQRPSGRGVLQGGSLRDSVVVLSRAVGRVGPVLAVALAVVLPAIWLVTSRAHAAYEDSIQLAREGHWPEAVAAARRAVERDGSMAASWFQLGAAHASAAIEGDRRAEQQAALDALRRGLELEPHNGAAYVNYAALNVALDRPEVARAALPAIARLAGRDSLLLLAHATLTEWTSPPEDTIETYAGLLVINPTLAATSFWQDGGFRAANFDRIVDRALERVSEVAGPGSASDSLRTAISVYAGRGAPSPQDLQAALAERPNDVALRVSAGRLLMSNPTTRDQAYDLLRGAVRQKSDDPAARAALGDWYALSGDLTRARREWAAAAYLDDLPAAISLGASLAPDDVPEPVRRRAERLLEAAEIGRFYLIFQTYRFTFQRTEPVPIILPGDWLLALPHELESWRETVENWRN